MAKPTPASVLQEAVKAVEEHKSQTAAAEALDIPRTTLQARLRDARRKGITAHEIPDGFKLAGTSTLYDCETGEAKLEWVKITADQIRQNEMFQSVMEGMADELPRVKPVSGPKKAAADLCACYPIGDHHTGMLAWHEEAGDDYDLAISEELLMRAVDRLVETALSCESCLIALLGDFLHYDSFTPVTPANRNQLDADSRYPKMVRVAIRMVRYVIERALKRHSQVTVIVEIGNHDPATAIFVAECLANIYEREPRIVIDTSPRHFHYFRFGKNLVGTHHGHGVKMDMLPLIMATDRPQDWGATEYRYVWTGHIHHDSVKDVQGVRVESFRVLPPTDAWAANAGYRSMRDMKSIILHKEYGEVERHIVNPRMLV